MITDISVKRSTQQISRLYAVRSIIGVVTFKKKNFPAKDRITGPPELFFPKIPANEPDDVPIGNSLLSSSFNVLMSL